MKAFLEHNLLYDNICMFHSTPPRIAKWTEESNLQLLTERQVTVLTGSQVTVECMYVTKFQSTFKYIFKIS